MRVFKDKIYLILLIIIIVIGGIWYSFSGLHQDVPVTDKQVEQEQETAEGQQSRLKNAEFIVYNSDKTVKWELTASEIFHKGQQELLEMIPVTVKAYRPETGRLIYSLTGNQGYYAVNNDYFEIKGPVNLVKDKYEMKTGNLIWHPEQELITGAEGLQLNTPQLTLRGDRFKADATLTSFTVYGNDKQQAYLTWEEREDDSQTQ